MSLRDEFPSGSNDAASYSRIKHKESDDISREINNFIACGGKITILPVGVSKNKNGEPTCQNEFDPTKPNEYEDRKKKGKKGAMANKKMKTKPTNDFGDW